MKRFIFLIASLVATIAQAQTVDQSQKACNAAEQYLGYLSCDAPDTLARHALPDWLPDRFSQGDSITLVKFADGWDAPETGVYRIDSVLLTGVYRTIIIKDVVTLYFQKETWKMIGFLGEYGAKLRLNEYGAFKPDPMVEEADNAERSLHARFWNGQILLTTSGKCPNGYVVFHQPKP